MRPNYQLKVFNDEFYNKDGNEPKTIPIADCEYWELTSVTGSNAEFLGISTQGGTDVTGDIFIEKAYDDRQIEFTLSIKPGKASSAELELTKYVKPGTNAILFNAAAGALGNDIYLKGVIAECYVIKDQQGATATIIFQPYDRFWYQSDVKFSNTNGILEVLTDAPAKPYIHVQYDASATTPYITKVDIRFLNYTNFYNDNSYTPEFKSKSIYKGFVVDITEKKLTAQNLFININCGEKNVWIGTSTPSGDIAIGYDCTKNITFMTKDTKETMAWDWTLDAGTWSISIGMTDITVFPDKTFSGTINPKWAVYPYQITNPEDGFIYSKNLTPANIKKDVSVLGVTGEAIVADNGDYTGAVEVTPKTTEQVLKTDEKVVHEDITIKAIEPQYEGKDNANLGSYVIQDSTLTEEPDLPIYTKKTCYVVKPKTQKSGWFKLGTQGVGKVVGINLADREKLISENIKKGVTILGTSGSYEGEPIEEYTGTTEITPDDANIVLKTENKKVTSDITIKAIEPVYDDTNNSLASATAKDTSGLNPTVEITDLNGGIVVTPKVGKAGWYKENTKGLTSIVVDIPLTEKNKIVSSNIKKGVTILGTSGSYEVAIDTKISAVGRDLSLNILGGGSSGLTSIGSNGIILTGETNYKYLFGGIESLKTVNFANLDTTGVVNLVGMFSGCSGVTDINLSGFNTESVTDMDSMFQDCSSIETLDLSSFNTENVTNMDSMFAYCSNLKTLNLSSFNTKNLTITSRMFDGCTNLKNLTLGANWGSNNSIQMFSLTACKNLTIESLTNIIDSLASKTNAWLYLQETAYGRLTQELIDKAKAKGWIIQGLE